MSISISEASLLCPVISIPIILFCTCPVGKVILYKEPISISRDEWLYGHPKHDETDSVLLKTLPVSTIQKITLNCTTEEVAVKNNLCDALNLKYVIIHN